MKLTEEENNTFIINNKKPFKPTPVRLKSIKIAYNFAYDMTFGFIGEHRSHRSGGNHIRNNSEKFANTYQGKLAEFVLRMVLHEKNYNCSEVDISKYGLGKWDEVDLICNGYQLNVKSIPSFGHLLLLEEKDWDRNGIYLPSNKNYDYHFCVRIRPDIKNIMKMNSKILEKDNSKNSVWKLISNEKWFFDIAGYIPNDLLVEAIKNEQIIPQGALLNGKIPMDATNYYIQSGDFLDIDTLDLKTLL